MRNMVTRFLMGWLIILPVSVAATDDTAQPPPVLPDVPGHVETWVDTAHDQISQHLLGTADRVDSFFGDERINEEQQNTQISLTMSSLFRHDAAPLLTFPLGLKLSLPRLENRVQLAVDTLLQESDDTALTVVDGDTDEQKIQLRLRYKLLEQLDRWISVDGGVKTNFDSIGLKTLEPFGSLRVRESFEFESWAVRLTQLVEWYEQSGWEGGSRVELDHDLGAKTLVRLSANTDYAESFSGQRYDLTAKLRRQLSHNRALGLQIYSAGETHPAAQITLHEARLTYRRRIYKEWAFFSIQPIARFARDDDFAMQPLLRFDFEVYFGRTAP